MPAKPFEGTITEAIHLPGIGMLMNGGADTGEGAATMSAAAGALANIGLKVYVRANKVAYDMSMLGGMITMHSIIDRDARTMTMLLPTHQAMVFNLRSLDTMRERIDDSLRSRTGLFDSLAALLPQPTGNHETMHGLDAEEYRAGKGKFSSDIWLSSDAKLQAFDVVRDAFLGRGTEGTGGLDEVFGMLRPIAGKIPVKFETKMNGQTVVSGELTDVSEVAPEETLFEIPAGYTVLNGDSVRAANHAKQNVERHNATAP